MDNELKLLSPAGADSVLYYWPLCKTKQYNGAAEIVDTIRWVNEDYPELKIVLEKYVLTSVNLNSYESMKNLCDKYNKAVTTYRNLWKGATKPNSKASQWASSPLLRHIIQQCYNRSVVDPDKLNQYEPFSPEVYGETSFDLINRMLEEVKLSEDYVFIDLGSGVGQVVIQVAAASKCAKCIGIERSDVPSDFAVSIEKEFRKWMKWYGKKYQDFELIKGDFFEPKYRELIMNSNLIFVNNFAFGPEVDHKLKLIFAEMKDGTKIVSSKAFCPINFRVTDRHMTDIGSILNVVELSSMPGAVSWTGKPVTYYLHTIDRTKLETYFTLVKNNGNGAAIAKIHDESSSRRNSPVSHELNVGSRSPANFDVPSSSSHTPGGMHHSAGHHQKVFKKQAMTEEEEAVIYGPTTRRQWSSWVAQQEKNKRKNQDKEPAKKHTTKSMRLPKKIFTSSSHAAPKSPSGSSSVTSDKDNISTTSGLVTDDAASSTDVMTTRAGTKGPKRVRASVTESITAISDLQDCRLSVVSPVSDDQSVDEAPTRSGRRPGRPRKGAGGTAMLKARQEAVKRKYRRKRKLRRVSSSSAKGGASPPTKPAPSHKKKSADWIETLDLFHKQIVDSATAAPENAVILPQVQVSTLSDLHSPKAELGLISPISTATSRTNDDALSTFLHKLRQDYEKFVLHMQSDQFKRELITSIDAEQKRQKTLTQRSEQLEKQVQMLQEEGSQLLNSRLTELGMSAVNPAELLNKAKEIVVQHQDLQARAALLETEVKNLEMQNHQLVQLTRVHDEATLQSPLAQSMGVDSHDEAKNAILHEIGNMFSHRKAYLNEISRMENEIRNLESFVQLSTSTGIVDAALMKSPFASPMQTMPHVQTSAQQHAASVQPSVATTVVASGAKSIIASPMPTSASTSSGPTHSLVIGRRPRGSGRGGRGSAGTGLRKRQSALTPNAGGSSLGVLGSDVVGASVGGGLKALDTQRRDDIDEQVEEMVRKIKNMNNAASLSTVDKEKRGNKNQTAPPPDKKPTSSAVPVTTTVSLANATTSSVSDKRRVEKKRATPSSIDQTVDAVCHGYSSATGAPQATDVVTTSHEQPVITQSAVVDAGRRGSLSSVTDSLPSDHEESNGACAAHVNQSIVPGTDSKIDEQSSTFKSIFEISRLVRPATDPRAHVIAAEDCRRSSSVGASTSEAKPFVAPYSKIIEDLSVVPSDVIQRTSSPSVPDKLQEGQHIPDALAHLSHIRPSSVPVTRAATPVQSPSPFSIGALLIDERPTNVLSGCAEVKREPYAYPRVRSADPRLQQSYSSTASDSGYDESVATSRIAKLETPSDTHAPPLFAPPSSTLPVVHEPRNESIPSPSRFKNTSNTGQPGNPHEYSNPGNPQMIQSRTLEAASPQDVIESKTLLNPFRIPRRSLATIAIPSDTSDTRKRLDGGIQEPDTRSPLESVAANATKPLLRNTIGRPILNPRVSVPQNTLSDRKKKYNPEDVVRNNKNRLLRTDTKSQNIHLNFQPQILDKKRNNASCSGSSLSSGHTGSQRRSYFSRFCSTTGPPLTRECLERHVSSVNGHRFVQQGLMEALLEHKMSTGKVESHAFLATKLDNYFAVSRNNDGNSPAAPPGPKTPQATPPSSCGGGSAVSPTSSDDLLTAAMADNQRKHNLANLSPRASPDCGISSNVKNMPSTMKLTRSKHVQNSNYYTDRPSSSKIHEPKFETSRIAPKLKRTKHGSKNSIVSPAKSSNLSVDKKPDSTTTDFLNQLATLANIDAKQASKILSDEALQTLRTLDPALLVVTLTTLLGTIMGSADKKAKRQRKSVSSPADDVSTSHQEAKVTSTCDADIPPPPVSLSPSIKHGEKRARHDAIDMDTSSMSSQSKSLSSTSSTKYHDDKKLTSKSKTMQSPPSPPTFLPQPPPPMPTCHDDLFVPPLPPPIPDAAFPTMTLPDFTKPPPCLPPLPLAVAPVSPFFAMLPPPPHFMQPRFGAPPPPFVQLRMPSPIAQPPPPPPPQQSNTKHDSSSSNESPSVNHKQLQVWNAVTSQVLYMLPCEMLAVVYDESPTKCFVPLAPFFYDYRHKCDPNAVFTAPSVHKTTNKKNF